MPPQPPDGAPDGPEIEMEIDGPSVAVALELALAVVAGLLGWAVGLNPFRSPNADSAPPLPMLLTQGVVATLPMLLLFAMLNSVSWSRISLLRSWLQKQLQAVFRTATPAELLGVALAAGIGEEALFRGLIQQATARAIADWPGAELWAITLASLLFGLAHAVNLTYAVIAAIIGAYLGWLYQTTNSIYPPVVTHALYDWIALLWLLRQGNVATPKQ